MPLFADPEDERISVWASMKISETALEEGKLYFFLLVLLSFSRR